jgi:hypothetical protein
MLLKLRLRGAGGQRSLQYRRPGRFARIARLRPGTAATDIFDAVAAGQANQ